LLPYVIQTCTPLLAIFPPFFFTDTPPPALYTLSLHDALPIFAARHMLADAEGMVARRHRRLQHLPQRPLRMIAELAAMSAMQRRSEEHTSELQSLTNLVCRLLLEKKNTRPERHMQLPVRSTQH